MGADTDAADVLVTIVELAAGGDGVGPDQHGRTTFVAYAAPGERVRARVTTAKKRHAHAELIEVIEPSAARVTPGCPLFASRRCGGCQWQHLDPAAQAAAKETICRRELRRSIAAGMEIVPIAQPVAPRGWRRRARLHWIRPHGAERAFIGFFAPRSHRIVDVATCPQLTRGLADAVEVIREHLAPHLGSRGEISLVIGHHGHVHVVIDGYLSPEYAASLVGKGGLLGTIVGVALTGGPASSGGDRSRTRLEWGKRSIALEPGLRGRADHFAQASEAGNQALLAAVVDACGPREGKRIVEFHAGGGNLTRVLAPGAAQIVASDTRAPPWTGGSGNRGNRSTAKKRREGGAGRAFRVGAAADVARELAADGYHFDLAVLDPPRTGAADLLEPLAELRPARIVYVSCDPATLARDIDRLTASGYRAIRAQPLDLMPQTAHVEVVVRLDRTGSDGERGEAQVPGRPENSIDTGEH